MADIIINMEHTSAPLKRLHGVNNGPVAYGSLLDVTSYYQEAGIPLVRLHDTNYPNPGEVDIHTIFRDFDKDADDPSSYDFSRTDTYINSVLATGAEIVYRLGESIEHTAIKYYVHPPQDMEKWARVCVNIIRHYNHGWASGYHHNIRYWEIWNEPDNPDRQCMWSGTAAQYYDMYRITVTAIKRLDPDLKVGGQAATMVNMPFTEGFIAYCQEHRLPLDFFTWHTYANDPRQITANAIRVRALLDEAGFQQTESHLNEWNYMQADEGADEDTWKLLWKPGGELFRRNLFERQKNEEGASFVAAVLALLQDYAVDEANYYDGQPHELYSGLFDGYGIPQKTYRVFERFNEMCSYSNRVQVTIDSKAPGIYGFGVTKPSGETVLWISNFSGESRSYTFAFEGCADRSLSGCQFSMLDKTREFHEVETLSVDPDCRHVNVHLPRHSVFLLRMTWLPVPEETNLRKTES
ncbi:GH39 family glycosyl hydrolase [Paenibacillus mendelii]|uniref:Glycosyl hydrolases family 39 N-terminal catalytic domain-containing protein n=1 Tax=Paenibacillus mendelii TaxID=206163 RepID=A0ABV6JL61_9BACL|nr:hypothetical protein [Paenibacillus mendelii]MCQ6562325.1 hypothetical protein [Paenibacillus mendelii]